MKLIDKNIKNQQGISLLGVIVAMFIVVVGIVGVMGLFETSFKAASSSKKKLIASNLNQEALEVVRHLRRKEADWNAWYSGFPLGVSQTYLVQYNSDCLGCCPPAGACPGGSSTKLKKNSNGIYQYNSGDDTLFSRTVTITKMSSEELKVVSEVTWPQGSLKAESRLWNWR